MAQCIIGDGLRTSWKIHIFCICLQGIQDWPWWGYDFQTKGTANLRHVEICQVLLSADGLFQWWWLLYMDVTECVLPTNMHKLNGSIRNMTIGNLFWTTQSGAVRLSQTGKVMRKMMIYQRILGPVFLPDHVFHYITKIYIDHHWSCHILIWTTIALSIVVTDHVQKDHVFEDWTIPFWFIPNLCKLANPQKPEHLKRE